MTIFQQEAIACIEKLNKDIQNLEATINAPNTWQDGYLKNCINHIESHKKQIAFLKKEYNV